jgi:alpha-L-rhamnosidase
MMKRLFLMACLIGSTGYAVELADKIIWPEFLVEHLRCEYLNNPLGIDSAKPRLGWEVVAQGTRGIKQVAYQVLVASSEEILKQNTGDLWDSGKVASDRSIQIVYGGKPLVSRQSCFWKVKVWSISHLNPVESAWSKSASFEMGLLEPDSWKAKWIGLGGPEGMQASPLLRKEVDVTGKVKRARVYMSGLG